MFVQFINLGLLLTLSSALPSFADEPIWRTEPGKLPSLEAQRLGFRTPVGPFYKDLQGPYQRAVNAPFIRMVRTNGDQPIEARGCSKIEFMTNVGKLLSPQESSPKTHRPIYANVYVYTSLDVQFACQPEHEYVEAGMSLNDDDPGHYNSSSTHAYFVPYIRRAPDEKTFANETPPPGWIMRRGRRPTEVQALPGFWEAANYHETWKYHAQADYDPGFDPRHLMAAVGGEFCFQFSLDTQTNEYVFHYKILTPASGSEPYSQVVRMPSVRATDKCKNSKIQAMESRLLTTVAIMDDGYFEKQDLFQNLGLGVSWNAEVNATPNRPHWEPFYGRNFSIYNYDPTGKIIHFKIERPTVGMIETKLNSK